MNSYKKIIYVLLFGGIIFTVGILFNKCNQCHALENKETKEPVEISQIDQIINELDELLKHTPEEIAQKYFSLFGKADPFVEKAQDLLEDVQENLDEINKKIKQLKLNFSKALMLTDITGSRILGNKPKLSSDELMQQTRDLYNQDTANMDDNAYEQWNKEVVKVVKERQKYDQTTWTPLYVRPGGEIYDQLTDKAITEAEKRGKTLAPVLEYYRSLKEQLERIKPQNK